MRSHYFVVWRCTSRRGIKIWTCEMWSVRSAGHQLLILTLHVFYPTQEYASTATILWWLDPTWHVPHWPPWLDQESRMLQSTKPRWKRLLELCVLSWKGARKLGRSFYQSVLGWEVLLGVWNRGWRPWTQAISWAQYRVKVVMQHNWLQNHTMFLLVLCVLVKSPPTMECVPTRYQVCLLRSCFKLHLMIMVKTCKFQK